MRGISALHTAVLFSVFSAAVVILAFLVDAQAQFMLDKEVQFVANDLAENIASQLRDVISAGLIPGVVNFTYALYLPTVFPQFDAVDYVVLIENTGEGDEAKLVVELNFTAYRGVGVSHVYNLAKFVYAINTTAARVRIYIGGYAKRVGPPECEISGFVNLTRAGCGALLLSGEPYKPVLFAKAPR